MLTFGVIICTYKRFHLLEKCLTHWSRLDPLPDQLIVVDATPNAEQYFSQLIEKFPQLFSNPYSHYIVTKQPGLTRQRNLGLTKIKTDIVCFTDDDTFVTPTYRSKILEVFQNDSQHFIGGVNGVSIGQFDHWRQRNSRLLKNYCRHHLGYIVRRIHVPKEHTQLFMPLPSELQKLPLIHVDRLWGANMNYRTKLLRNTTFDESFQRYGLYEDVELSVRVGKTHKLVCRLDAKITHDETLGQSTRLNGERYFLASWLNSTYIIEKLFPCEESRDSHQRLFQLTKLLSRTVFLAEREKKVKTLGNEFLLELGQDYISRLKNCQDRASLSKTFVQLQHEIYELDI